MIDLKIGEKFTITYFAKKYGKFITRAGYGLINLKNGFLIRMKVFLLIMI
jgi:hypothetical protein